MAKLGKFNHENLTVSFGVPLSKPHNIFVAQAVKVPDHIVRRRERESIGNGWYGQEFDEWYEDVNNLYVIVKDGVCIGQMRPYSPIHNIKDDLIPCNDRALEFLKQQEIEYKPILK